MCLENKVSREVLVYLENKVSREMGVVMIPKNYTTLKQVNEAIRERKTTKEYRTIVKGSV